MKALALGVALTLVGTAQADEYTVTRHMMCADDLAPMEEVIEQNGLAPFVQYKERMKLFNHGEQEVQTVDGTTFLMLNDQNHVISFWVTEGFYCMNTLGMDFKFEASGI